MFHQIYQALDSISCLYFPPADKIPLWKAHDVLHKAMECTRSVPPLAQQHLFACPLWHQQYRNRPLGFPLFFQDGIMVLGQE